MLVEEVGKLVDAVKIKALWNDVSSAAMGLETLELAAIVISVALCVAGVALLATCRAKLPFVLLLVLAAAPLGVVILGNARALARLDELALKVRGSGDVSSHVPTPKEVADALGPSVTEEQVVKVQEAANRKPYLVGGASGAAALLAVCGLLFKRGRGGAEGPRRRR